MKHLRKTCTSTYLSFPDDVWQSFEATDIIKEYERNMFLTVDDALAAIHA